MKVNGRNETAVPVGFRYREVFLRGKTEHDRLDPFSIRHPKMDTGKRAKIFSPFDALKGFSEAVGAKTVLYEEKKILSEEESDRLDRILAALKTLAAAKPGLVRIAVTYFVPCGDQNHEAYRLRGRYQTVCGICKKVDTDLTKTITLDGIRIPIADILKIESDDRRINPETLY